MEEINADLHIHGRYSAATSKNMDFHEIARGANLKGVEIVGTGDILHPLWRKKLAELEKVDGGTYATDGVFFVPTVEIEDARRVHHLVIFPSLSSAEQMAEELGKKWGADLKTDGRPKVQAEGWDIAEMAVDAGAIFGPCHAFTPWTALYASHDTLETCYRDMTAHVSFLELGLSADTDYADRISELHRLTFLSNSDAHSPSPIRLAREFNRLLVEEPTAEEVIRAIQRKKGRGVVLNVGFPPQEGKYNETACVRCYRHYTLAEARQNRWKCVCGGRIKKGVRDRVEELADLPPGFHPPHRPPYLHIIPLGEIIAKALGLSSPTTKKATEEWQKLVEHFGSEVRVLVDASMNEIKDIADPRVVWGIKAFRDGKVIIRPGGGGKYGEIIIPAMLDGGEENTLPVEEEKPDAPGKNEKRPKSRGQQTIDMWF